MRSKHPHEDLDRAVRRLQPLLQRDGIEIGDFIAAGAQGNVYEAGPGKVVKVMYGGSLGIEWRLSSVLMAREAAGEDLPAGLVRTLGQLQYQDPTFGLNDPVYRVYFLVRERLQADDSRARAALSVLQGVLHWLTSREDSRRYPGADIVEQRYYDLAFGNADLKIVALGLNYLRHTRQLPDDAAARKRMERDALALHGAFMWLYGHGYKLKDYFGQYEVKPENVGFRGNGAAVALDLGYVSPVGRP